MWKTRQKNSSKFKDGKLVQKVPGFLFRQQRDTIVKISVKFTVQKNKTPKRLPMRYPHRDTDKT